MKSVTSNPTSASAVVEEQVARVSALGSAPRPRPALLRWTVPALATQASLTFVANVSAGCHTTVKM